MRKNYLLFLIAILFNAIGFAQHTVSIGGNSINTTTSGVMPINSCWGYNYTQQIIRSSEFVQGNGAQGVINKIRYYYPASNTVVNTNWNVWTVYIGTTTNNTFANTTSWVPMANLTQVYTGAINPIGGNWMEITFTTPYSYNGTDNLVVAIHEQVSGFNCTANWSSYTASGNQGIYYYSDSTNPNPQSPPSGTLTSALPQLQFDLTPNPDACLNLNSASISHTDVSSQEVNISFAGGVSGDVNYVLTTNTNTPTAGTSTIANGATSLNLPNLTANTQYYLWYRKLCANGQYSGWAYYNFKTACGIVTENFYENFETTNTGTSTNNTHPTCWSFVNTVNPTTSGYGFVSTTASYAATGSRGFYTYRSSTTTANGNLMLISPETNNLGSGTKRIRFRAKKSLASYVPKFEIYTINGNTATATRTLVQEVNLTTDYNEYIVYLPNTTDDYFAFSFDRVGTISYVYIDDIYYEDAPSCIPVTSITVSNVAKFSSTVSWSPTLTTATATYSWELRTSGAPGSGATGLAQSGTTAAGVTTLNLTNLSSSTTYYFYVKANCLATDSSTWDEEDIEFTTICDYPDLLTVTADPICGIGSSVISATSSGGLIQWFLNQNSAPVFVGNEFTTPVIDQTTTFYVRTGQNMPNTQIQVGEGTTTSSSSGYSPYATGWGGYKTQYIFTAEELVAAGLSAGPINKVGFEVTSTSDATRNGFTIHIGSTTQATATNTHVGNLTQVYSNAAQSISLGINNYTFTTPYLWDGTSNVVVQVCWSNNNTSQSGGVVRYHQAPATRTTYTYADNRTPAQLLATMTGSVANDAGATSGSTTTTTYRANTYFNGVGLCASPFTPVTVNVTPSPEFALSSNNVTVCQGNHSSAVTVATGASDYDTYTFTPSVGVNGNAQTGWTFNPQETTTYSVIASQSNGLCAKEFTFTVYVTSLAYETLDETYVTCANETLELSIMANEVDVTTLPETTLSMIGFESGLDGVTFTGTVGSIAQVTSHFSQGTGSLKWTYGNSSTSYVALNNTFNGNNSYGLLLEFDNIANLESCCDYGYVQYSLDGGNTWVTFTGSQYLGQATVTTANPNVKYAKGQYNWSSLSQTSTTNTVWRSEKYFLPSTTNNLSNVKFRFALYADGSVLHDGWFLDNIKVKKVDLPTISWSPATNLYLDNQLTQPYAGESVGTVYFNQEVSGNYPYEVTVSNDMIGCTAVIETEVVIPTLVFPGLTNSYYCTATPVEDLQFNAQNGVEYVWYNSIYSQTPLETIPFTGTYYVQIVADDCVSSRQAVQINVIGNVNVTVNATQYFCDAATVSNLHATPSNAAGTIYWYSSADATQPLAGNTPLVNGQTYYVNQVLHGCASQKLPVQVVITQTPNPINFTELSVCSSSTIGSVVVQGYPNLRWYTSNTSTTALSSQLVITPGTYYISAYAGICDSQRIPVNVNVVENLSVPQVSVIDICGSGTVADLNQYVSGTNSVAQIRWFNTSTSTTALSSSEQLTSGTYYVDQYLSGCTSVRKAVAVRVTSRVAPVINAQQVCQGTRIQDIVLTSISGVTYKWYTSPTGTQELAPSTLLTTGNYFVRRVQYGCVSEAANVQVMVLPIPTTPTGELNQNLPEGSLVSDIIMNQPGVIWYNTAEDALANINPLQPNMPLVDGQTYYGVLVSSNGCRSIAVAITINLYLGINDLDIADLKVYPNPTNDMVTVSYKEVIDSVEVYSMLGQKVVERKGSNTEIALDLTQLSAGTYIIKVVVGQNSQLVKVVKK